MQYSSSTSWKLKDHFRGANSRFNRNFKNYFLAVFILLFSLDAQASQEVLKMQNNTYVIYIVCCSSPHITIPTWAN